MCSNFYELPAKQLIRIESSWAGINLIRKAFEQVTDEQTGAFHLGIQVMLKMKYFNKDLKLVGGILDVQRSNTNDFASPIR